ncbi:MAG: Ig-like domain-containing protein [bacterium]|nr:Ig-like domain-containing protein [bacterium]
MVSPQYGPTVEQYNPPQISGTQTVRVSVGDRSGIQKVEFFIDDKNALGTPVYTDMTYPYEFLWNTASVSSGYHYLVAKATDKLGNSTISTPLPFLVIPSAILPMPTMSQVWSVYTSGIVSRGIAFNPVTGHLLMSCSSPQAIYVFSTANGSYIATLANPAVGWGATASPYGITVDSTGVIYVADYTRDTIWHYISEADTNPTVAFRTTATNIRGIKVKGSGVNSVLYVTRGINVTPRQFFVCTTSNGTTFRIAETVDASAVGGLTQHIDGNGDLTNGIVFTGRNDPNMPKKFIKSSGIWSYQTAANNADYSVGIGFAVRTNKVYGKGNASENLLYRYSADTLGSPLETLDLPNLPSSAGTEAALEVYETNDVGVNHIFWSCSSASGNWTYFGLVEDINQVPISVELFEFSTSI